MATKTIKRTLAAVGCVVALAVGVYVLRESLLRTGLNIFLDGDIAVTKLQGLQLNSRRARIDNLELLLATAGQQLTIADIELDFSMQGLFAAPIVENLVIGSARLTNASDDREGRQDLSASDANLDNNAENSPQAPLLLSELLQQLRNFPLKKLALSDLELPQLRQKLALNLDQQADGLQLRLASGSLQLEGSFTQQSADATAQFRLVLQADEATVAEMELLLQPQATGYAVTGNGTLDFSDANTPFAEYLTTPLPVSAVALQWNVAANATDDLLQDPTGNIDIAVLAGSTFVLRPGLVPDLGELAINIPERAQLSLAPGAEMKIAGGRIPLRFSGTWRQQTLQSAVILTPSDCKLDPLECSIGFESTASLAAYTMPSADPAAAITIDAIEFAGNGNVRAGSDLVELKLDAGARLSSSAVTGPAYSIASMNITTESVLDVSSSLTGPHLTIAADDVSLALAELKTGEYQVSPAFSLLDIKLEGAEKLAGTLTLQTPGLVVTGPQWLPTVGFDADMSIDGDMFAFSTPLLLPGAPADPQLQANGSYDLAAGTGQVTIKLPPLALSGPGNSLSSYLTGWPYPADIMTGTLALDVDVQLSPEVTAVAADAANGSVITGSTNIVFIDVAGFYAENFFRGLTTTINGTYDSTAAGLPVTTPPLNLTLAELNVGVAITDIVLDYQLDAASQIANIRSISGAMLDGTVSGMDINYDFSKERNEMTFMFAGLRLERMLELAEYEGIEAVGAVSGELPITVTGSKVEVDAGRLYAEEPGGSIRYLSAPPEGQGNPAMDLVNQALSNYQFQSLESTIDYSPEGELLLGMQLRGHNPDMNGGQAINLNLNISDNIPQLLKSLQAGRAIEDFLQEQYK